MWWKEYRDYPLDRPLIKYIVQPGFGIIGCEMHELNGWGTLIDRYPTHYPEDEDESRTAEATKSLG